MFIPGMALIFMIRAKTEKDQQPYWRAGAVVRLREDGTRFRVKELVLYARSLARRPVAEAGALTCHYIPLCE